MAERTTSTITIDAAPSQVMAVIADFEAYPEWAGAVRKAEVLAKGSGGRAEKVRMVLDAGAIKDDYVLSYQWDADREVRWRLAEKGQILTAMDGAYSLSGDGSGGTQVTYTLTVDVKVPMIGMFKRKAEKVIIDTALKELKKRVEG